jgi:ankyrin repeat protein
MSHKLCNISIILSALQNGYTALLWAAENGHIEVVRILIAAGATLQVLDKVRVPDHAFIALQLSNYNSYRCGAGQDGRTALMLASLKGHEEVVELLLAAGADLHLQNNVSELNQRN